MNLLARYGFLVSLKNACWGAMQQVCSCHYCFMHPFYILQTLKNTCCKILNLFLRETQSNIILASMVNYHNGYHTFHSKNCFWNWRAKYRIIILNSWSKTVWQEDLPNFEHGNDGSSTGIWIHSMQCNQRRRRLALSNCKKLSDSYHTNRGHPLGWVVANHRH